MEWSDLKLDLVQLLLQTNDKKLLDDVKRLLDPQDSYIVPDAHKQLVRERKEKYRSNPPKGKTFEEIEAKLLNKK